MSPFPRPRVMIVLLASLAMISFASFTLAQKGKGGGGTTPPPPPPEGTIFFRNSYIDYSMKADGSQVTAFAEKVGSPSHFDYGGYRWCIVIDEVGDGQFYPLWKGSTSPPQPHVEIFAYALSEAGVQIGERIQLTDLYPDMKPFSPTWSTRDDACISFGAAHLEYDEEGYRITPVSYGFHRLEISPADLEANTLPPPATMEDDWLWTIVPEIPPSRSTRYISNASWSPDGAYLVFIAGDVVGMLDVHTGEEHLLLVLGKSSFVRRCDWSPEGDTIVMHDGPPDKPLAIYTFEAFAETPTLKLLLSSKHESYGNPTWSPDGKHICLSRRRVSTGALDIARINADGTGLVSLLGGSAMVGGNGSEYPSAWRTDRAP